jgi:hypothetical protein
VVIPDQSAYDSLRIAWSSVPWVVELVLVEELDLVVSISGKTVTNEFKVNKPPMTPLLSVSIRQAAWDSLYDVLVISE